MLSNMFDCEIHRPSAVRHRRLALNISFEPQRLSRREIHPAQMHVLLLRSVDWLGFQHRNTQQETQYNMNHPGFHTCSK